MVQLILIFRSPGSCIIFEVFMLFIFSGRVISRPSALLNKLYFISGGGGRVGGRSGDKSYIPESSAD